LYKSLAIDNHIGSALKSLIEDFYKLN